MMTKGLSFIGSVGTLKFFVAYTNNSSDVMSPAAAAGRGDPSPVPPEMGLGEMAGPPGFPHLSHSSSGC